MPQKSGGEHADEAKVCFSLTVPEPDVGGVSVVGDFNGWDPDAGTMVRQDDGTWTTNMWLPLGHSYAFRYLAADGRCLDDDAPDGYRDNGYGGWNAIVDLTDQQNDEDRQPDRPAPTADEDLVGAEGRAE